MSSTTYGTVAQEILDHVGGAANVRSLYHCQTRLRFDLKDPAKADEAALRQVDGVATTIAAGTGMQVVVGVRVTEIYDEVSRLLKRAGVTLADVDADSAAGEGEHKGPLGTFIDFMAGVFTPAIPVFAGAGMVRAVLSLLVAVGVLNKTSQNYVLLDSFAGAVFYFLPILLAFSAATKLKSNPYFAAVTAAIMLNPTWTALVAAKKPVDLFGIPLFLANYSSSVVPILLIVWVQAHLERVLNRVIPAAVRILIVPLLTILIMGTLALSLLGPIGDWIGAGIAAGFTFFATAVSWAPPLLVGALWGPMVALGIHHSIGPLGLAQIATVGFDNLVGPGILLANCMQGVAALVVALRTKDAKLRSLASATGFTAIMGVTEPVLYGVNVPKRYPLIAGCIGAAVGGLFAGITATRRFAAGVSGVLALPMYIGNNTFTNLVNICIALGIGTVITAALTWILAARFERVAAPVAVDAPAETLAAQTASAVDPDLAANPAPGTLAAPVAAVGAIITPTQDIVAPVAGEVLPIAEVPDPAFASEAMGPGVGIKPTSDRIVSPVTGTVVAAMKTGHAFGIRTDDGVEVLVHVGIDTVRMKGDGFTGAVSQGSRVQAGEPLVTIDRARIAGSGYSDIVVLAVTNAKKLGPVRVLGSHTEVIAGEPVLTVQH